MQPYQEASQEINRQQAAPRKIATNLALGAAGGGAFIGKIAPFLSKYVPEDLAIKGMSKISPKLGKFISGSMTQGHTFEAIKDFIGSKIEGESSKEPPKENRNIIEMESPELHQFILNAIKGGKKPFEAAMEAIKDVKLHKKALKLEKEHKTPWQKIVQSVYGGEAVVPEQAQSQGNGLSRESLMAQGQQQQPQQGGQGQQALMQIMQKINQRLGG